MIFTSHFNIDLGNQMVATTAEISKGQLVVITINYNGKMIKSRLDIGKAMFVDFPFNDGILNKDAINSIIQQIVSM